MYGLIRRPIRWVSYGCRSIIVIVCLVVLGASANWSVDAQSVGWTNQFGTIGSDQVHDIVVADDGSIYVVGGVTSALPGQVHYGGSDAFISKYDGAGNGVWTRQFGAYNTDVAHAVDLSPDGHIYVAGNTRFLFSTLAENHGYDVFLAKYSTDGDLIWLEGHDTSVFYDNSWYSYNDGAAALDVDEVGNIYLGGSVWETWVNMIPEIAGNQDLLLLKYDADGNQLWAQQYEGPSGESAEGLQVDSSGNVYVVGGDSYATLLQKYSSSGMLLWSRLFNGEGSGIGFDVALRESDGAYFVIRQVGSYGGQASYGGMDIVLVKSDFDGNQVWAKQFGTTGNDYPYGVTVDGQGGVLVTGGVSGALPGQTYAGALDLFLSRFDDLGNNVWHMQFGGTEYAVGNSAQVDSGNNIIVGGFVNGTFPGEVAYGSNDGLLMKVVPPALNTPPIARAGEDLGGFEGSLISFVGTNSTDPDGTTDIVGYEWDFGDGSLGFGAIVNHTYADSGNYNVTLTVTDSYGETDTDSLVVTVTNVAPSGTLSASPIVDEGDAIHLSIIDIFDPSNIDTAAGFEFAFDCDDGSGFVNAAISTATCSTDDNGSRTVRGRILDKDGGYTEYSTVVVVANVAPAAEFSARPLVLNEGQTASLSLINPYDPSEADVSTGFTYSFDCDDDGVFDGFSATATMYTCSYPDNGVFTTLGRIQDKDSGFSEYLATVDVSNVAPTVGTITAPLDPAQVETEISASASFTDPGILDTHTATWDWGDSTSSDGIVTETNGSGDVTGSHIYGSPGVYTIKVTVTDKDGDSGESFFQFVVVYDPDGGFVTGGGWIDSPEGAYIADPSLTGKANFGFVSKYKKGATVPTGNTEFQFKAGDLNFRSDTYDWLIVAGPKGQFKGTGTINGAGEYGFMLTAIDGQVNGGGGVDKFRIKIWDKATGAIIYDNQLGADDNAEPTIAIGGGSIVVHKSK